MKLQTIDVGSQHMLYHLLAVLDFLSEEATDDAWVVSSYLSDADFLLASPNDMLARSFETENLLQLAAASVATRGVLFGNSHPSSSRYGVCYPNFFLICSSLRICYSMVSTQVACHSKAKIVAS